MSAPLHHCASCGAPFARVRQAQRTCSNACKQSLHRAEKCNAGHSAASEEPTEPSRAQDRPEPDTLTRIWGPQRLSEIELRMLGLEPTGLRSGGSMLYRRAA